MTTPAYRIIKAQPCSPIAYYLTRLGQHWCRRCQTVTGSDLEPRPMVPNEHGSQRSGTQLCVQNDSPNQRRLRFKLVGALRCYCAPRRKHLSRVLAREVMRKLCLQENSTDVSKQASCTQCLHVLWRCSHGRVKLLIVMLPLTFTLSTRTQSASPGRRLLCTASARTAGLVMMTCGTLQALSL